MLNPKKLIFYFILFWAVFGVSISILHSNSSRFWITKWNTSLFSFVEDLLLSEVSIYEHSVSKKGSMEFTLCNTAQLEQSLKTGVSQMKAGFYKYNPKHHIYTPLAFLLALCLATPLTLLGRLKLLGISIVGYYLYAFLRIRAGMLSFLAQDGMGVLPEIEPDFIALRSRFYQMDSLGAILILIIIVWATATFISQKNRRTIKESFMLKKS